MTFYGTDGNDRLDVSEIGFDGFAPLLEASSEFNGTQDSWWTSFDNAPRQVADVNGDGRADIIGFGPNKVAVALGQANGTFGPARGTTRSFTPGSDSAWASFDKAPRQVADVNGDGRADIIGFGPNIVAVALGQADGTFRPARGTTRSFTPGSDSAWASFDKAPRQVADVNGDGRADIIGFGPNKVAVALGQADGTFRPARGTTRSFTPGSDSAWASFDKAPRHVADVNGDGRADIIGFGPNKVAVALGQANGTFGPARGTTDYFRGWGDFNEHPRQVADVNGDGRADIIGFGNNDVRVVFGQNDGTFSESVRGIRNYTINSGGWSSYERYPRQVADVNGDGRADIIGFGTNSTFVSLSQAGGVVDGGAGDDTLLGNQRDDFLLGGSENDLLNGKQGDDSLNGGSGNDTLVGDIGDDTLLGGADNDRLLGVDGDDFLSGEAGNDVLLGGTGKDTLQGGAGNDRIDGNTGRDRLIETTTQHFSVRSYGTLNQLRGSDTGKDNFVNIETVELTGSNANNSMNASLFKQGNVILDGLGGNDTLRGGRGDDTIKGGRGENRLWGGAGEDTFILEAGGIQNIYDFDRTADTIDVNGVEKTDIEFERNLTDNYTLIIANDVTQAKIFNNTRIDISDLSGFSNDQTYHPSISLTNAKNLDLVIEAWAENYAQNQGLTYLDDSLDLSEIELSQGKVTYDWNAGFSLPDDIVQSTYVNKTDLDQPGQGFDYTKEESTTSTVTQEHGFKLGASYTASLTTFATVSAGVGPVTGEAGTEVQQSFTVSGEYSQNTTVSDEVASTETTTESFSYIAPKQSVTNFEVIRSQDNYTGTYEYDVTIGGDISFGVEEESALVVVPVNLILEQYNPDIFSSKNENYDIFGLPDGTELTYSPELSFGVSGTLDSVSVYNSRLETNTTQDVLLSGMSEYSAAQVDERLWVATGQRPLAGTAPVRIRNFAVGRDQVGFGDIPEITGIGSLDLSVRNGHGIIRYGNQPLAILPGVNVTQFTANDFVFDTSNTAL